MSADSEVVVVAKYDYTARDPEELDIRKNERLVLLDDSKQWWRVQNGRQQAGFVPSNYVRRVKPSILGSLMNSLGRKGSSGGGGNGRGPLPVVSSSRGHNGTTKVGGGGGIKGGSTSGSRCECSGPCTCPSESLATVRYAYQARQGDELTLCRGEQLHILEKCDDGWWRGRKAAIPTDIGWFPSNYVIAADADDDDDDTSTTYCNPAEASTTGGVERAVTLYSFQGEGEDTLTFGKDELLEILDKAPSGAPDWWRARKADGHIGLVPKNYVQVVEGSASTSAQYTAANKAVTGSFRSQFTLEGPYASEEWFFGDITRSECDDVLGKFATEGQYMVRSSETNVSACLLT
jgi:hypothetical protein